MKIQYTAVVEVFQVESQSVGDRGVPKDKQEIARIIVRADTLEDLKAKLAKHVELV